MAQIGVPMSCAIQFKLSSLSSKKRSRMPSSNAPALRKYRKSKPRPIILLDDQLSRYLEERRALAMELDQAISLLAEQIREMCRFILALHGKIESKENDYVN